MTINEKIVNIPTMSTEMNNAEKIIDRFGGQSALAKILGRRQSTIQHWAITGRIPSQWQKELLKMAKERGIALEPEDFVSREKINIEPAEGKLGVLLVGLGAISSTLIAGIEHVRREGNREADRLVNLALDRAEAAGAGETIRIQDRPHEATTGSGTTEAC